MSLERDHPVFARTYLLLLMTGCCAAIGNIAHEVFGWSGWLKPTSIVAYGLGGLTLAGGLLLFFAMRRS